MKKFLSLVLALVMTMSLVTVSAGAKDFSDDGSITYKEAVDVISGIGVVDGYSGGDFKPTEVLTRGAAAKIICNLILGPTTASYLSADTAPFKDVPVTNVFAGYITYCSQQGIINGYADGTFRPTATLSGNAFMKMLLGALGYDSAVEGYTGANWTVAVIKQAAGIGLDDGNDEFVGSKAVTREEAALYAFNMLQATMVEYDAKTTVDVNGATVTIAGDKAKEVAQGSYDNNMNKPNLQFAERYFDKLDKTETTDDFARPATKWTFKGDKIGTYADAADVTYTSNVKLGDIYSDLDMSEKDKNAEVYYNGVEADDVAVSKGNTVKVSSSSANDKLVADGSTVEVFYDEDNNDVTICIIDTYVGTISSKEEKVSDPYVVVNAESLVTEKDASTSVSISGSKARFETNTDNFEEDDVVLFTYSQSANEIKSVVKAESVEGTLDKYTLGKNLTLADTEYKYSKNIAFSFGSETSMTTKSDYVIYLDANGMVIYVDEQEFDASQYAYVLYTQSSNTRFGKDQVQLVMSDGSVKTVDTDDDYTSLEGTIVYYRADDKGEYALRQAANVHKNGSIVTTEGDATYPIATYGVLRNGATTFDMKNTRAAITTKTGTTVYGNSETVFVVAESTAAGKTDYSVYKGIKNAPTIMSTSPAGATPSVTSKPVEMVYTTSGSSDVVTFAFIDATGAYVTNGKRDVVFLAAESATKMITDGDNNQYYLYNAVVDDEITTVKVKAVQDTGSVVLAGNDTVNQVVTNADYNNKGLLTSADNISSTDYDRIDVSDHGTGVWKLSGSYSIGLGGTTASASTRYTVASDAKMYYIDTDGVITKIDDVKNISSDSTATYIGLLDVTDGDIAYLFIQEVDNGKQEGAGGGNVVLSSITASYNSVTGKISVTLNGTNAGQNYPVTVSLVNGGTLVQITSKTFTGTAGSTTDDISATLGTGIYQIACGDQTYVLGV